MAIDCTAYPAGPGTAPAFIVLPGGGYSHHADHEGRAVAEWLNAHGVHALVVRYGVGEGCFPRPLHDAREALIMLREGETELAVLADHVGVIGFSAGGHLAALLATDTDDVTGAQRWTFAGRPDAAILCYPVIELRDAFAGRIPNVDAGVAERLLGGDASEEHRSELSPSTRVTSPKEGYPTPPMFLWTTSDDETVSVLHTTSMMLSLSVAGVPHEGHVFVSGRHGLGLATEDPAVGQWTDLALEWLRGLGWPVD
ncbi:MAG TPA: alpha/beta hydrolase [Propionibacteriaceae bacterium]|nr:alpha/beta hydrolase [Propionibacteriaceae bacterium]